MIDVTPTLRLRLHRRIYFFPEDSFFWREHGRWDLRRYRRPHSARAASSKARFIGNQLSLPVQLQVDRHLTYTIFYSRFFAGRLHQGVAARAFGDVHQHLYHLQILTAGRPLRVGHHLGQHGAHHRCRKAQRIGGLIEFRISQIVGIAKSKCVFR